MIEEISDQATPQATRTTRGSDRCEKCKSQHVRCDGERPTCRRCRGKGHTCIYVPKRLLWTVYTDPGKERCLGLEDAFPQRHPASATSILAAHSETTIDAGAAPSSAALSSEGRSFALRYGSANALLNAFTSDQLHSSPDAIPVVGAVFHIDARYVPGGYFREITSSMGLTVSYASLPALYQSILQRKFETDPAVLNVRGSVLQSINQALRKSKVDDSTIISIKHQLYYDCFIASKPIILAHLNGLRQMVCIRGGLHTLGLDGDLAHMLKVHTLMAYIIAEYSPPSEYLRYKTHFSNATVMIAPVDLSYCPLLPSPAPSPAPITVIDVGPRSMLHSLISLLQQMTDSFLNPSPLSSEPQEQLYTQVLRSPLCNPHPSDPFMGWIYESCRLAGLIFAAAIRYCVPLSSAVIKVAQDCDDPSLLENLYRAVFRSPYASQPFWCEWAGCFLWVSLVSASVSQCGVQVQNPDSDLYWDAKSRRTALVVPFAYATKLFHSRTSSDQAFLVTEIMTIIQKKLAAGVDDKADSRKV